MPAGTTVKAGNFRKNEKIRSVLFSLLRQMTRFG